MDDNSFDGLDSLDFNPNMYYEDTWSNIGNLNADNLDNVSSNDGSNSPKIEFPRSGDRPRDRKTGFRVKGSGKIFLYVKPLTPFTPTQRLHGTQTAQTNYTPTDAVHFKLESTEGSRMDPALHFLPKVLFPYLNW